MRDIKDGTSQTIAFGEMRFPSSSDVTNDSTSANRSWGVSIYTINVRNTGVPVNSWPSTSYYMSSLPHYGTDFSSEHEGGAFFAFCDGAVRFITENIDMTAYKALGTRANNEIIDDEDY